jgi:hypothetical protein
VPSDYRAFASLVFSWDGSAISRTETVRAFGPTHRDFVYTVQTATGAETHTCTIEKTATESIVITVHPDNTFEISLQGSNPLVTPSPPIVVNVHGSIDGEEGVVHLQVQHTLMPNIAFRVQRDGRTLTTQIVNDVSCRNLAGPIGATELAARLASLSSSQDSFTVPPTGLADAQARCGPLSARP